MSQKSYHSSAIEALKQTATLESLADEIQSFCKRNNVRCTVKAKGKSSPTLIPILPSGDDPVRTPPFFVQVECTDSIETNPGPIPLYSPGFSKESNFWGCTSSYIYGPFGISINLGDMIFRESFSLYYGASIRIVTKYLSKYETPAIYTIDIDIKHFPEMSGRSYLDIHGQEVANKLGKFLGKEIQQPMHEFYYVLFYHLVGKQFEAGFSIEDLTNKKRRMSDLLELLDIILFATQHGIDIKDFLKNLERDSLLYFINVYFSVSSDFESVKESYYSLYVQNSPDQESRKEHPIDFIRFFFKIVRIVMRKLEAIKDNIELTYDEAYDSVAKVLVFGGDHLDIEKEPGKLPEFFVTIPRLDDDSYRSLTDRWESIFGDYSVRFDRYLDFCVIKAEDDVPFATASTIANLRNSLELEFIESYLKQNMNFTFNVTREELLSRITKKVSNLHVKSQPNVSTKVSNIIKTKGYEKQFHSLILEVKRIFKIIQS